MANAEQVAFLIDRMEDGRLTIFQEEVCPDAEVAFLVKCSENILIQGSLEGDGKWPCEMPGKEELRAVAPDTVGHHLFRLRSEKGGLKSLFYVVGVTENGVDGCLFVVDSDNGTPKAWVRKVLSTGTDEALVTLDNRTDEIIKVEVTPDGTAPMTVECRPWLNTFSVARPLGDGVVVLSLSGVANPDPNGLKQTGGTDQADIVFP